MGDGSPLNVVTFDDISRLLRKIRSKILFAAICGAISCLIIAASRSPEYIVEATFKEGVEQSTPDSFMKDMFLNGLKASQQSQSISVMKSTQVLQPVIEKYGLQARLRQNILIRWLGNLWGQCLAEWGILIESVDSFSFAKVHYTGERIKEIQLRFSDPTHFRVLDRAKILTAGVVGSVVNFGDGSFVCEYTPKNLKLNESYPIEFTPLPLVLESLRSDLSIRQQKISKSIYEMRLLSRDRHQGALVLNEIMESHRSYLKRDHDETAEDQIAYLEKKQTLLFREIGQLFDAHSVYLANLIKNEGFVGLTQEIGGYLKPHDELKSKVFSLNLELDRLDRKLPVTDAIGVLSASEKIRSLESQKSLLPACCDYLASTELPNVVEDELDLETSQKILSETLNRLDQSKATIQLLGTLSVEVLSDRCDPSSMAPFLNDRLSQQMMEASSQWLLKLKDKNNHSHSEIVRANTELVLQKKMLFEHLQQLSQVEAIHLESLRQKKEALQQVVLRCMDREIGALKQQIEKSVAAKKQELRQERDLLEAKMSHLREAAKQLPERWKQENWLELKLDLGKKMMTMLTQMVESKTVERHLHAIESKPLDAAVAPIFAKSPHLFLIAALGAFFSAFFTLLLYLNRGIALTSQSVRRMELPVLETMSDLAYAVDRSQVISLIGEMNVEGMAAYLRRLNRKVMVVQKDSFYEWMQSGAGVDFLSTCRAENDHILFYQPTIKDSASTKSLLKICNQAVVAITNEKFTDIAHMLREEKGKLSFIFPEEFS